MIMNSTKLTATQVSLLICEGLILLFISLAFWYPIDLYTGGRQDWLWTLWLAVPVFAMRLRVYGNLWTHTYLHDLLVIFIILTAFSYANAPFQRESYLSVMGRPLLGIWSVIYFIELTRVTRSLKPVIILFTIMSATIAFFAIGASQWDDSKMGFLRVIADPLPQLDAGAIAMNIDGRICNPLINVIHETACFNAGTLVEKALLSFHVNEIAGAMAWLIPVMVTFAFMKSPAENNPPESKLHFWLIIKGIAGIISIVMIVALILGQSRFAIVGVFATLTLLILIQTKKSKWKYRIVGIIAILMVIQGGLLFNVFSSTDAAIEEPVSPGLSSRDAASMAGRFAIWEQSIRMTFDYPSTGIGLYRFRTAISWDKYSIPYTPPPHAHNEWLNIGAEMGLAGLLLYISIQGVAGWMLWQGWSKGDTLIRTIALATFAGFLSHAAYGLGDVIALWDRLHFIYWWLLGLTGAQYNLLTIQKSDLQDKLDVSDATVTMIE